MIDARDRPPRRRRRSMWAEMAALGRVTGRLGERHRDYELAFSRAQVRGRLLTEAVAALAAEVARWESAPAEVVEAVATIQRLLTKPAPSTT